MKYKPIPYETIAKLGRGNTFCPYARSLESRVVRGKLEVKALCGQDKHVCMENLTYKYCEYYLKYWGVKDE